MIKKKAAVMPLFLCAFLLISVTAQAAMPPLSNTKEKDIYPFVEEETDVYNYCPCVIGEGSGLVLDIFYCKTYHSDNGWMDHIHFRRTFTIPVFGKEYCYYTDDTCVLEPTEGSFDSHHVCDPSVIAGDYTYEGSHYKYMMAYLATTHKNAPYCRNNEIGLCLSNDLINWTKTGKAISSDTVSNPWGVGQPSLIKDCDGNTLLLYTGDNMQAVMISDDLLVSEIISIDRSGTKNMHNADFAIKDDELYVIYDANWTSPDVSNISSDAVICKTEWDNTFYGLEDLSWEEVSMIGEKDTGFAWNHNACFMRDDAGNLLNDTCFITKCTKSGKDHEYTYRIFEWNF